MPSASTTAVRSARRLAVAVLGASVILLAAILFFTPAPSSLVFLAGLAILASEFLWAGRLLQRVKALRKTERNTETLDCTTSTGGTVDGA